MFKIPQQEYTAEFKELAVKRAKGGQGWSSGTGTVTGRADATQLGQGRRAWRVESGRRQAGDAGTDGIVALVGRERPASDGVRNPKETLIYSQENHHSVR